MKRSLNCVVLGILFFLCGCGERLGNREHIIFVSHAGSEAEILPLKVLVESLRTYGGRCKDAPVWIYASQEFLDANADALKSIGDLNVEFKVSECPEDVAWYPLADRVFAAAKAEAEAAGKAIWIAVLGSDTIILEEPEEFFLPKGISLGYRPVFHRNINPLYQEPLDEYWTRAYQVMGIRNETVFPMVTPADGDTIRPYFQSACLVVRPENGLLQKWVEMFYALSSDPEIKAICEKDARKLTFTFQVALTGAVLNNILREEMVEFSDRINYPIFFKELFGAKYDFHDITNKATLRYEHFFSVQPEDWDEQLQGPADKIAWIKERFPRM